MTEADVLALIKSTLLSVQIKLATKAAALWPDSKVLLLGQLGHEEDTGLSKIGNGYAQWSALDYLKVRGADVIQTTYYRLVSDSEKSLWGGAATHAALTSGNPHNVTKADLGITNVDNTADMDKPVSTAQAAADTTTLNSAKSYADGIAANKANIAGGNTFTGAQSYSDNSVSRADLVDCSMLGNNRGSISGTTTQTLDYTTGSIQIVTITGGTHALGFSNWPSSGKLGVIELWITNAGLGSWTYPAAVSFKLKNDTFTSTFATYATDRGGASSFVSSGLTVLRFVTVDAGATIYCEWL